MGVLPAWVVFSLEQTFFLSIFVLVDSKFDDEVAGELFCPCSTITSLNITEERLLLLGTDGGDKRFVGLCNRYSSSNSSQSMVWC